MHQPQATESPEAAVPREGTHGRPWEDEHGWQKSRGITKARTTPPKGLITEPSSYPNSKNRKRRRGSPDLPNPSCTTAAPKEAGKSLNRKRHIADACDPCQG